MSPGKSRETLAMAAEPSIQMEIELSAIVQGLKARMHLTALWIGLAMVGYASPSLVSATDPAHDRANASVVRFGPSVLSVGSPSDAVPQARPDFSGLWSLDAAASDDPQEKVRDAMKAIRQASGGGHGAAGGAGGQRGKGGMGGGRKGRGPSEAVGTGRAETPYGDLSTLIAVPVKLDITHDDPMLLVSDENDQRQRLFTDLRGASVTASGGLQQPVAFAGWEGDALVVETKMNSGLKLVQNYQISSATNQLTISVEASLPTVPAVSYRLVYNRLQPSMGATSGHRTAAAGPTNTVPQAEEAQ